MSRRLFASKRSKRKPRIEIIPMVDVMFLLLVFYILASISLTIERGIPVALPGADTGQATVVEETKVTITSKGDVYLNHEKVDLDQLGATVEKLAQDMPGGMDHLRNGYVVLNIDMDVTHRKVVKAMDQLREVGITNFSIATEDED